MEIMPAFQTVEIKKNPINLSVKLCYFPSDTEKFEKAINTLLDEGWAIKDKWNFKETETEDALHNPEYSGTVILERNFNS